MSRLCILLLLLWLSLCCTSISAACPTGATCVYVAPTGYSNPTNASHPFGAADNPFVSISAAILAANPSPSAHTYLLLYTGTYSGPDNNNLNIIGMNLVLVSNDYFSNSMSLSDAASGTIIDGGLYYGTGSNCITVSQGTTPGSSTVSIIAITIQYCASSYGPAISANGVTLNLNGVQFLDNVASASGGAIFATTATVNMANSYFQQNDAASKGGAMYFLGCTVTISNTHVTACKAVTAGAGYIEGGTFTLTKSLINSNVGTFAAGGFSLSDVQVVVSDCQFLNNIAGGGNALDLVSSVLRLTNTIFYGGVGGTINGLVHFVNAATSYPGVDNYIINCTFSRTEGQRFSGVSIENSYVGVQTVSLAAVTHIINSSFIANFAIGDTGLTGGALHGSNSAYTCSGCIFKGNYGAQLGAAAVCETGASCKFDNCIFEENYSWSGAAVYIDASVNIIPTSAQIINCTFMSNAVLPSINTDGVVVTPPVGFTFLGGAVFVGAKSHLSIVGGSMVNNSAQYGGAIYIDTNFGNIKLSNIVLQKNQATQHGGGIYLANFPSFTNVSVQPNITALTLLNNVAVNGAGGGIYVAQGIANYNPALYGAAVLRSESQVCALCNYAGNIAPYGNNLGSDPFELNVQVSPQGSTTNMNIIGSGDAFVNGSVSISSSSTVYVSAALVDFFGQQVSVVSGVEVNVSVTNGIISNLVMTGSAASTNTSSSVASSTNDNIFLINGATTFSLSLLSYPGSQASVSVSVPQVSGLAAVTRLLEISVCTDDEFVAGISQNPNLAVCSAIASMPSSGKAAAIAVIALSYLVLALFFIFFVVWRNHKVVYQSSIVFCVLIMLGLALVNTAALLSALDKTVNLCTARIFLLHAGYAFAIGSVSVKLFRLQLIFNNPLLVMLKLSDAVMLWRLLLVLLVNIAPVIVWTVVDPFQSSGLNDDACTSSNSLAYELTLLCFNGLLLFSSAYFAFCLRNTPSQYNETTALAVLNYVVLVLGIVWILLRWIGNLSATSLSLAEAFLLTCATFSTSCILFGPKVYVIVQALMRKAARMSSQSLPNGATRTSCCWLLLSGMSSRHTSGKTASERFHSDHSVTVTPAHAASPGAASLNHGLQGNAMDFDELDENVKNSPNELNTFLLDKIGSLKDRLQSRVAALKQNARQWASAEKDIREIIGKLGSACSEFQFLHSRGNRALGSKDPTMELINDPLVIDAANAIGRAYPVYMSDSGGTGTATSHRNDRRVSNKAPATRRAEPQVFASGTPTNTESKHETATGRTAPMSGRSAVGKQGSSSGSSAAAGGTATVTSPAMPSKHSVPNSHDSAVVEHGAVARLPARLSVPLIEGAINHAETDRNSARGSRSSRTTATGNGNGSTAHDHIELEQVTLHR